MRFVSGDFEEASAQILKLVAPKSLPLPLRLQALAIQAASLAGCGAMNEALIVLEEAFEAAGDEPFIRVFLDLGPPMKALLERLAKSTGARNGGAVRERTMELLGSFGGPPAGPGRAAALLISPREAEVLAILAEGLSNKEIAGKLFVSEATVKTHVYHIAAKLEARNRGSIVVKARALGLLS
jgi:DNA-binding CsgD family transcriptional regulator